MSACLASFLMLAADEQPPAPGLLVQMMPLIAIGFLLYFMLLRPQRREQGRRDEMLNALKKNDRVVTIGGIMGTVAQVSEDRKEVTLKVDDNTRIKFLRSAIQSVLRDDAETAKTGADKAG